jgi:DNA polymerase-3 subunit gamma/tau
VTYQVLARRLRPQRFEEVVGQEHVTRTLQAAIAAGRVAHAFLFTGPRGVGKTTTARLLAKALNCERGPAAEPCNECANCHEIAEGNAFDVLEIDGASHTQVDKMRELMETAAHRPIKSRWKIFIIDEVHMLSSHSFNALLKTLEEPPPHVKFIFATTDPHKVLPTVVSRCQRYDLRRIGLKELREHLDRAAGAEKAALSEEVIALIAREAEGSLRDAQSLLEQVLTAADGAVDVGTVRALLGAADRRLVVDVADAILGSDPAAVVRRLGELHAHGYDPQRFCRDLLEHFRDLAVLRTTGDLTLLADLPEAEVRALATQAERRSSDDLQRFFQLLLRADEALAVPARTVDPRLVLEMCAVRLATLPPLLPVDEVLGRLESLTGGAPPAAAPPVAKNVRRDEEPSRGAAAGGLWEQLLERVQRDKKALYMALATGRLIAAEGDALRIGVENEAMRRELSRRETLEHLRACAREIVGRDVTVEIGPLPADRAGEAPLAEARRRTEETLAHPMVQAAVEIFGAEVRGVRDRRRP